MIKLDSEKKEAVQTTYLLRTYHRAVHRMADSIVYKLIDFEKAFDSIQRNIQY